MCETYAMTLKLVCEHQSKTTTVCFSELTWAPPPELRARLHLWHWGQAGPPWEELHSHRQLRLCGGAHGGHLWWVLYGTVWGTAQYLLGTWSWTVLKHSIVCIYVTTHHLQACLRVSGRRPWLTWASPSSGGHRSPTTHSRYCALVCSIHYTVGQSVEKPREYPGEWSP